MALILNLSSIEADTPLRQSQQSNNMEETLSYLGTLAGRALRWLLLTILYEWLVLPIGRFITRWVLLAGVKPDYQNPTLFVVVGVLILVLTPLALAQFW